MKKIVWEYKIITVRNAHGAAEEAEIRLNEQGKDYWELTNVITTTTQTYYFLKRPSEQEENHEP